MMKTAVKPSKKQAQFANNHAELRSYIGISDFDYKLHVFEFGMKFLETLYQPNWELICTYSTDRNYWRWWLSEFNIWEDELLADTREHGLPLNYDFWLEDQQALIEDSVTHKGFINYLKIFRNVRI